MTELLLWLNGLTTGAAASVFALSVAALRERTKSKAGDQ